MLTDIEGRPLQSPTPPANRPATKAVGSTAETFWSFDDARRQIDNLPDFVPTPKGPKVLLLRMEPPEQANGVLIPEEYRSRYAHVACAAVVIELGEEAYEHPTKFKKGPYCEVGDLVFIARYVGQTLQVQGRDGKSMLLTLVNDDEIGAVWDRPIAASEAGDSRSQPSVEDRPMPTGEGHDPEPATACLSEAA